MPLKCVRLACFKRVCFFFFFFFKVLYSMELDRCTDETHEVCVVANRCTSSRQRNSSRRLISKWCLAGCALLIQTYYLIATAATLTGHNTSISPSLPPLSLSLLRFHICCVISFFPFFFSFLFITYCLQRHSLCTPNAGSVLITRIGHTFTFLPVAILCFVFIWSW